MFGFGTMMLLDWRGKRQRHLDASLSAALTKVKFAQFRLSPAGRSLPYGYW
jgi:hypothetical protein